MSKRAERRHHRERIVAHACRIRRRWYNSWEPDQNERVLGRGYVFVSKGTDHTDADANAVKFADHLKACGCISCGNPRRYGGFYEPVLTRQERLADLDLQEQLTELPLGDDEEPNR